MQSNTNIVPEYILKKLILLYGFGKELYYKSKSFTDPLRGTTGENYYLINGEWINKFKEFYNYSQIKTLLEQCNFNYQTYDQYKNNINQILFAFNNCFIYQNSSIFPNELKNGNIIFSPKLQTGANNINYFNDFYIVNYDLNELLSKDSENPINPNYSFVNKTPFKIFINQNIYFIHLKNIEIGQLNFDGLFMPKYYIKPEKENPEEDIINIIKYGGIEKYINSKKIDINRCLSKYNEKGGLIFNIMLYKSKNYNPNGETGPEPKDSISHEVMVEKNNNNINQYNNQEQNMKPYSYAVRRNKNNFSQNDINQYDQLSQTKLVLKSVNINLSSEATKCIPVNNQNQININIQITTNNNNGNYPQNYQNTQEFNNSNQYQGQNQYNNMNTNNSINNYNNNINCFNNNNMNLNNDINMNNNMNNNMNMNNNYNINNNINNGNNMNNMNNNMNLNNNMNNNMNLNNNNMSNNPNDMNYMNNNSNNDMNMNYINNMCNGNNMNNDMNNINMQNMMNNNNNSMSNNNINSININANDMNNFGMNNFQNNNNGNNNFMQGNFINQQNMQNMNIYNQQQQLMYNTPNIYNNMNQSYNNNHSHKFLNNLNYVPMIGLVNLGQTCYMNSVLQCMSNLSSITNFFLNQQKQDNCKQHFTALGQNLDNLLCIAYKELIENLWKGPMNQPYSPIKFKQLLQKLNPIFANNTAGDSKDFFNFLIIQLHNELNGIEINPQKIKPLDDNVIVDPFNEDQVFKAFMSNFASNYSVISRYFYGVTQGQFECQNCKNKLMQKGINLSPIKYNFESFFYLEFPLEKVRKYVAELNNNLQYYQNITEVNLYDCFNYNQKLISITGYCEKCKRNDSQINTLNLIYSPSPILVLIFNRGKGKEYKIKINFEEKLDISKIVIKNENLYYELQGVVKHLGESTADGHFIAFCRTAVPMFHNNWYCFNDQSVTQVNDWNDIINSGDTYMLFYELKKNN